MPTAPPAREGAGSIAEAGPGDGKSGAEHTVTMR